MNTQQIVVASPRTNFSFPADVRYFHYRNTKQIKIPTLDIVVHEEVIATGGATVCYYIDHEKQEIRYAFSFCNDNEPFIAEDGAKFSLQRLINTEKLNEIESLTVGTISLQDCKEYLIQQINAESNTIIPNTFYKEKYMPLMEKANADVIKLQKTFMTSFIENTTSMELVSITAIRNILEERKVDSFKKYRNAMSLAKVQAKKKTPVKKAVTTKKAAVKSTTRSKKV